MKPRQVVRAALRDEWDGLDRITRDIRPADVATMANALLGLVAIVLATRGHPEAAAHLVLAGIILDGVDGAIARMGGGGGPLGGFLDSIADMVTFAVAPAVLLTTLDVPLSWSLSAGAFFLVCVALRLARFEALREKAPQRYFSGMSSPGGALVVVSATLWQPAMVASVPVWLPLAAAIAMGPLLVSRIRYPKLRGALGAAAVLMILATLATWQAAPQHHGTALSLMLAFMLVYLVAGPFYVLQRVGPTPDPRAAAPEDA
ncbi:MAG: CDP-alcohol phosphatidyltransferase family protein [Thermoplasmatota archaeon]